MNKKRILITGAAGFIGSNFVNYAAKKYPKRYFIGLDSLTSVADKRNIAVLKNDNFVFVKCDIRDRDGLERVFKKHKPTDVIHFAAESHVDVSIKDPLIFCDTNVGGTNNLLHLSKKYKIDRFHHISTDEVYGALSEHDLPFDEKSPLEPNNPYSASKAAAEMFVRSYWKTFGLDVVITRSSNNYGPRQDGTKLIPLFINRLIDGKKVPLYGKGEQVRDWLYVEDNVRAIDMVFNKGKTGEIYNIGGDCEFRNIDIARQLLRLTGRGEDLIGYVEDRLGHDFRYALDTYKIRTHIGWEPRTSFLDGLKKTYEFYKEKK